MDFFFKGFLNINTTLKQFVEQFGFALAKRVKEEDKETFNSNDPPLHCATDHIFEHVFQLYTSRKFFEFQQEVKNMSYNNATKISDDEKQCVYDVIVRRQWYGRTKRTIFQVTMDKGTLEVRCDCKNFEFKGIMCSHSLRVFHEEECNYVPERYILDRWRKDLPRKYLKIPVPYYSLLKKKPKEMKRYEKLHNTFEPISTVTMTNDKFFDEVLSSLSDLSVKSKSITEDEHGLMSQSLENIGKVYGRRVPKKVVNPFLTPSHLIFHLPRF
ncbi:protein FAR1-RELATED SEQUENCE 5-like [Spinacia oleracea]|uniref:Protein FAR1-RELATED SEQUENCE n=1 Tax=Spinacia oleracea TaxID=3562 RepID=A0A9R0HQH4_SPIOL|nr:protein FAR1-RELATED SEQUENCE 5-like [Spinacia oleracea]